MTRLIDADALAEQYTDMVERLLLNRGSIVPSDVTTLIVNAPTVDAVKVVRCKDCFWFDQNIYRNCFRNRSEDEYAEWGVCTKLSHNMKVNDYCSCGEREAPYKGGDIE